MGLNQETDQTNFQAIEDTLVQLQKDVNFKNDMVVEGSIHIRVKSSVPYIESLQFVKSTTFWYEMIT